MESFHIIPTHNIHLKNVANTLVKLCQYKLCLKLFPITVTQMLFFHLKYYYCENAIDKNNRETV